MISVTVGTAPSYATPHSFVYAPPNYSAMHSRSMQPHELVQRLVRQTGKSTLQVAVEMHRASFQGTLHKLIGGQVASPSRQTAQRISRYFKIPIEAMYDSAVARRVAVEQGLVAGAVHEPVTPYKVTTNGALETRAKAAPVFSARTEQRLRALDPAQRKHVEAIVVAHLDAIAPDVHHRKSRAA
jgi:hypothetical protein